MTARTSSPRLDGLYSRTLAEGELQRRWGLPALRALADGGGTAGRRAAFRARPATPRRRVARWMMAPELAVEKAGEGLSLWPARPLAPKAEGASVPVVVVVQLGPDGQVVRAQVVTSGGPSGPVPWVEIIEALKRPAGSLSENESRNKERQE